MRPVRVPAAGHDAQARPEPRVLRVVGVRRRLDAELLERELLRVVAPAQRQRDERQPNESHALEEEDGGARHPGADVCLALAVILQRGAVVAQVDAARGRLPAEGVALGLRPRQVVGQHGHRPARREVAIIGRGRRLAVDAKG